MIMLDDEDHVLPGKKQRTYDAPNRKGASTIQNNCTAAGSVGDAIHVATRFEE